MMMRESLWPEEYKIKIDSVFVCCTEYKILFCFVFFILCFFFNNFSILCVKTQVLVSKFTFLELGDCDLQMHVQNDEYHFPKEKEAPYF